LEAVFTANHLTVTDIWVYRLFLVGIQYLLPLGVICYAYSRVIHRIWLNEAPGTAMDARDQLRNRNKRKVISSVDHGCNLTEGGRGEPRLNFQPLPPAFYIFSLPGVDSPWSRFLTTISFFSQ